MTQKEIDAKEKEIRAKYPGNNWVHWSDNDIANKDRITLLELDIRNMMISNLCYGTNYWNMVEESWYKHNRKPGEYDWECLESLGVKDGLERVHELWDEMSLDFQEHTTVHHDTYTDSEGLTYNSIDWDD